MDDMILASSSGTEEKVIDYPYDIDIGAENTFELSIPISDWTDDLTFGKRIYIPNTEYGGIIKNIASDTSVDTIYVRGYVWRGYLTKRLVMGTFSGDLNSIIRSMLGAYAGVFVASSESTGVTSSITLSEYTPVTDALREVLSAEGYRLNISYVQTESSGYVELSAVPAAEYGDEVSQDSFIDFSIDDNRMWTNHLIVSNGTDRVDVYADTSGTVSTTQTQVGIDEITELYEVDSEDDLEEKGTEELLERIQYRTMTAKFADANDIELEIGDYVTGVDYVTGITVTKPITSKILAYKDNELSIQYGIEEEGET